ncbi:MAG: hypothetical protein M3Q58_16305 [Bacteroidota bacterium]|nr:hypothetical protein [Bacteroidota bacterium]
MEKDREDFEMMESYFEDRMSEAEKASFEAKLILDENFKDEFEVYKKVRQGIFIAGEAELRDKLKAADKEIEPSLRAKDRNNIIPLYKKLLVAASIAALISMSYLLFLKDDYQFRKFEEKEPGLPVLMNNNEKSALNKAMTLYKAGEYSESKEIIENLLSIKPENDTLLYFNGVVNYELEAYSKAADQFEAVSEIESVFNEQAEYRLALSYLRLSKENKARVVLEKIVSNPSHLYKEQAQELLKQL